MKRISVVAAIVISVAVLLCSITSVLATNDGGWLGMDHAYGTDSHNYNSGYPYQTFVSDIQGLGISMSRQSFFTGTFGAGLASYYQTNGIKAHSSIYPSTTGFVGAPLLTYAAYYTYCYNIMSQYKGQVFYYIVGNEFDGETLVQPDTNQPLKNVPAAAVEYCHQAWLAAHAVDPTGQIKIESPPTSNPVTAGSPYYLQTMINDGIANYCDYIGVHAYGGQITDGSLRYPWIYQQESGYPMRPVVCSEMGASTSYAPSCDTTLASKQQWQANFLDVAYVELKRWGYSNVILYESVSTTTSGGATFCLVRNPADNPTVPTTIGVTTAEIASYLNETDPNASGNNLNFENMDPSGEYKHGWVYFWNLDTPGVNPWTNISSLVNYQETTNPHSGAYCMQFNTSTLGQRIVRRVVSAVPKQTITVSAWVYSHNGGQNHLKVEGYNATDAGDDDEAATSTQGVWTQMSVVVTPTNPWIVIELSSEPDGVAGSYVNFDDVSIVNGDQTGTPILDTDFNSAALGLYGTSEPNGSVINSGGAASTQLTVTADSTNSVDIFSPTIPGATGQAMQFTAASSSDPTIVVKGSVPGLNNGSSGTNLLETDFDFCPLQTASNGPTMTYLINDNSTTIGAGHTWVQMNVRGLTVGATVGSGGPAFTPVTLGNNNPPHIYNMAVTLDLSSTTQETWSYTLTDLSNGGALVSSQSGLYTRTAIGAPQQAIFEGSGSNASPFIWIDNLDCFDPNTVFVNEATMITATNFDQAAVGLYGVSEPNGAIINLTRDPYEQMTVTADSINTVQVATPGGNGTGQALEFTNTSTSDPATIVAGQLPNLSTDAGGNNLLVASFDYCPLQYAGNGPILTFLINDGTTTVGAGHTVAQISMRGLTLAGTVGTGGQAFTAINIPTSLEGHVFHVVVTLDLSSATQDTWGIVVTDNQGGTVPNGTQSGFYTRTANLVPIQMLFEGSGASSGAFVWMDNLEATVSNTTQ